ncbi:MAG TPA: hypothetical protein VGA56_22500, partial [Opitutaceae bacterium]
RHLRQVVVAAVLAAVEFVVPYRALIAFLGECCRILVRLSDVCYTDNLATDFAPSGICIPLPR